MKSIPSTHSLIRLALLAFVLRALYFFQHMGSPFFGNPLLDQHYYDLVARQLSGAGGDLIDGFRPLLYPLFLSIFYSFQLDWGMVLAITAQHLLGIAMVVMIAQLAARLFGNAKAGLAAGLLFALSAPPLYFESQLLITTLFSFLLLVVWRLVFQALEARSPLRAAGLWLATGMVIGLAAQARPNALSLLLFFPMLTLFRKIRKRDKQAVLTPLLGLVSMLAIQALFGALNATYTGQYALLTQAGGVNFYLGNSLNADGMIPRQNRHVIYDGEYRDSIQVMADQEYREKTGSTDKQSPNAVSKYWKNKTLNEIKENPARWLGLMTKKAWLMLWNHEVPNNRSLSFAAQRETPLLYYMPVRWWLLLFLTPWGLIALRKRKKNEFTFWTLSFWLLFSSTVVLFFVNSRFRIPLWPGLAIMSGGGAISLWTTLKERRIFSSTMGVSIALLTLSLHNWFKIPPDSIESDLSMRAQSLYQMGRYEEALTDITSCLEFITNNPGYHFQHGNIQMALNNNPQALQAYAMAISLNPANPIFHNNRGIALENIGEKEQAILAYDQALKLNPNHRSTKNNLLLALIQAGHLDQAEVLLKTFTPEEQKLPTLQCAAAVIAYKKTGDPTHSLRAKKIHPELANVLMAIDEPSRY